MYRLFSATKDTYLTNKYVSGRQVTGSNVGQAGTLDLFALKNETVIPGMTGSIIELSRLLVHFDLAGIRELTGSFLSVADPSFSAEVVLHDVYGGQTVPSNFTVELYPLSKSWSEGRGSDVIAFRDADAANWATASLSPALSVWSLGGAGRTGSLGDPLADVLVSGNLGSGVVGLGRTQVFARGDEELSISVTSLVSASLVGILPDEGYRLAFIGGEEDDGVTRFVKRFGSRHALNRSLHPKLVVKYDERIVDPGTNLFFERPQQLFLYNILGDTHRNFISASVELTGTDCVIIDLVASKSLNLLTSSFSPSHNATIEHMSKSLVFLSRSVSGSQHRIGGVFQTGVYSSDLLTLAPSSDAELAQYLTGSQIRFQATWYSPDRSVLLGRSHLSFDLPQGGTTNADLRRLVVNMSNLQEVYLRSDVSRLRVFASDARRDVIATKVIDALRSVNIPDMRWRLVRAFSRQIVVPWGEATRLSTDSDGMYFDMYFGDLDAGEVYEFELQIKNQLGKDHLILAKGFRFKVIN